MIDPWREWQRMMRAGTMWSETLSAAHAVVGHRSRTIEKALTDPFGADHAELGRMVSEKSTAFGAAGASLARDMSTMQADMAAQAAALGQLMLGQLPTPRTTQAMVSRGQRLGSAALASSIRALTPVHKPPRPTRGGWGKSASMIVYVGRWPRRPGISVWRALARPTVSKPDKMSR
jgi:phage-related tail protein